MTEEDKRVILEAVKDEELSCAKAFQLSVELGLKLKEIGEFCDKNNIKIKNCRLGCF